MGEIRCTGGSGDGALRRLRSLRTLASCSCWVSIDIKVLTDLSILKILCILFILAILLQTREPQQEVWRKGLEDLNVYRTSGQKGVKVRKDLNVSFV